MRTRRNAGTAMLIVVGYLFAIMLMSSILYSLLNQSVARDGARTRDLICQNIAEGGLDKAIASLRADREGYRGETNTPLGPGAFTVQVQPGADPGAFRIDSVGRLTDGSVGQKATRVSADVTLGARGEVVRLRWTEERTW